MSGYEPKPRSPERLTMLNDITGKYDPDRGLIVTASFRYDEWCCGEAHEVVDAIAAVYEVYDKAWGDAHVERIDRINEELSDLRQDIEKDSRYEQLTLF